MKISTEKLRSKIETVEKVEFEFSNEELIEDLTDVTKILLDKTQFFKNIKIENKAEELERFRTARREDRSFTPKFQFEDYHTNEVIRNILERCQENARRIQEDHLEKYGAEKLTADDLQELFNGIFDEIDLYLKMASEIENEESWRQYSQAIWPMVDERTAEESMQKMKKIQKKNPEKNISPSEVEKMFRKEIRRLGMNYSVETRKVIGCFNSPEEKTVVVAEGENGERMYSEYEARMLTMHELFHSVRGYNGFKAGERSGFPEIIGLHTPFYDRAEEGGALYREKKTGTLYADKEFDYHLRLVAAYEINKSDNFREEFAEIAEKLIDLGASEKRAFNLLARNREALRHHIYLAGLHDWKKIENKEKMLIGKVNQKWAEKLWEEAEKDGMIQKPEIGAGKLFDFTFKDSE